MIYQTIYKEDHRYDGMTPIICYQPVGGDLSVAFEEFCSMQIGEVLAMPFFTETGNEGRYGNSRFASKPCSCSDGKRTKKCNEFDFMIRW